MRTLLVATALTGVAMAAAPASAAVSLMGSKVTLTPVFANGQVQPSHVATVGAGIEFVSFPSYPTRIDVGADFVDFINPDGAIFEGTAQQFNGFLLSFAGFALSSPTLVSGAAPVAATINAQGQLAVNFAGRSLGRGASTRIGVRVAPIAAAVPEPATWAMMMVGFGAMGVAMRRKKVKMRIRFA